MTKEAALHTFFSSFDIPAYTNTAVPDDAEMPYLTYDVITGGWGDSVVSLTVNVWYRTESEAVPNAKVREIADAIGLGGKTLICDTGIMWINRGTPWCVATAEDDNNIKRRYLNVNVEYLTV